MGDRRIHQPADEANEGPKAAKPSMTKKETKGKKEMTPLSVNLPQAQEMKGLSQFTLRRYAKEGIIRVARVGRRMLFPTSELERITKPGAVTKGKNRKEKE